MKKLLPVSILFFLAQFSFGQTPSLNMTLLDHWDPDTLPTAGGREYNDIWGFTDCSGNEYAIIGSASAIHFFDITNPTDIEELAYFPGGGVTTWRDMKTYRDRAYAASESSGEGLMIFDLSNIQDTIIKTYQSTEFFSKTHNIYIDEENGRLYAAGSNTQSSGLIVLDIATDPDNPQLLASVSLPGGGYVHDLYVKNNVAYCSHGYSGFYIWDFGVPTTPVLRATVQTNGYNHSSWVTEDGDYAVFAEEVPTGLPMGMIDVSDFPNGNIEVVSTFKFPLLAPADSVNTPHNPYIRGDYAITSYYEDGIQIFDISDPLNVTQVAYFDTYDNATYNGYNGNWGVYPFFPSGVIIASDINEGLFVLSADSIDFAPVNPNLTPDATIVSDIPSPFCEGETALLTVPSGEDSYEWFKDGQPIGENQNFLFVEETGAYHVEIVDGQCSAISELVEAVVKEGPDLSSLPVGDFETCENESFLIEAPDTLDQYVWLKDGDVYQQGGSSLEISETGEYSLLAYYEGCSSTSELISVTVLELPEANIINGGQSFCEGEQFTLQANDGGDLYTWFFNNDELTSTTVNSYEISEGGFYQVVVTEGICSAASDEVEIYEHDLPVVDLSFIGLTGSVDSNLVNLCYGELFTLAVPADPNAQFQWFKDGLETGANSNTLSISEAGEYYVEVVSENDCFNESQTVEVVISHPVAYITLDDGTLANQDQWATYQWFMDGNIIDGETGPTFTPTVTGEYHCVITNDAGCESVSNYITVVVSGLENLSGLISFELFPNPVNDVFNIEINTSSKLEFDIQIVHSNGKIMNSKIVEVTGLQVVTFNFSEFPAGVYFVKLKNAEQQSIQKIIKI